MDLNVTPFHSEQSPSPSHLPLLLLPFKGVLCKCASHWMWVCACLTEGLLKSLIRLTNFLHCKGKTSVGEVTASAALVATEHTFDLLPLSECCFESYLRMKESPPKPYCQRGF